MIECKVGKEIGCQVQSIGSPMEHANDVLCIINAVYNAIKNNDPGGANCFRIILGLKLCDEGFWDINPDGTSISVAVPKKGDEETGEEAE